MMFDAAALAAGRETVSAEAAALTHLANALAGPLHEPFARACLTLAMIEGRVIVTGMGKSGHIARKIAATFASTGRPAMFVHPAEASHGDLGMITQADGVLALSRSGETSELKDLIQHCHRLSVPLIGMTFRPQSTLAQMSNPALILPDFGEASEDAPAPTTSTTMCLAMGDALAVALLKARGFDASKFGELHPGGQLGALLKRVKDVMRTGAHIPLQPLEASIRTAMEANTDGGIGAVGVVDAKGRLMGVLTDGDLRRRLTPEAFSHNVSALMTPNPRVIAPDAPLADAIAIMNAHRITVLFAVEDERPVGVVHMQDLLAAGIR